MKKANTLLVLAIILSCQLSYAQSQVKRQFQDETFAETTVVIKENTSTSDIDVLNNYFDMDDVGMGQVIRITTENPTQKPTPAPEPAPVVVKAAPKAVQVKAPAEVEKPEVVVQVVQKQVVEKEEVAGAPAQPERKTIRSGGSSTRSTSKRAYIGNKKTKRVKAPKRKNKKRNSSKCYRF